MSRSPTSPNMLARRRCAVFAGLIAVGLASISQAAEIHFLPTATVDGGLVLLGDVAEIHDADRASADKLSRIDLLPAPPAKEKRVLRVREVQDLLHLRGVNPNEHRFTGASQITICGAAEPATQAASKRPGYLNVPLQQITKNVQTVLLNYITEKTGSETDWIIKFDLTSEQGQSLAEAGMSLTVDGGEAPWTGLQHLAVSFKSADGPVRIPLSVQVAAPPTVVVATQSLVRGAIIRPTDVRLQQGNATQGATYMYRTLEEVIGKEAARPIAEGQILDDQFVRRPLLVQKADIVTVFARTAGLRVRTTARALEQGSTGDLVRVESIADRKSYFARVTGPQEVEVYAHAPTAEGDASSTKAPPVRAVTFEQRLSQPRAAQDSGSNGVAQSK